MGLAEYSREELNEMSFIEVAYSLLAEKKQPYYFNEIMAEVKSLLKLSDAEVKEKIAQFYTDLNIDGRFLCVGDNHWGLRPWYPYDQIEEETQPTVRPKKKKAKKVVDEDDVDTDDFDLDEDELDYDDEIDLYDDTDDDEDDDDDLDDDDDTIDDSETFDDEDDDLLETDEEFDIDEDEEEADLEEDDLDSDDEKDGK